MKAENKSFETLMGELEALVSKLEGEELNLDDAIQYNEEALELIKVCRERLGKAKQKIEKLTQNSDGEWEAETIE
ncbi:MAG: exodeoxyribonuclease VII small subunit [Candidatus Marinimicrobia bacterium]|nr:exodeoxyribonuclease VII small subunit [Candidatus Neomarinimicrobiota bacterium]MCF7850479.1 exodeoxyribonuclease VII small subunit [Candidatus Neomarinimicrobiota bacterium]